MNKIACECIMKCTAENEMECLSYQPSDEYEGKRIKCIYNQEGECIDILANQRAILENLNILFRTMDETINAQQDTINTYEEIKEEKQNVY